MPWPGQDSYSFATPSQRSDDLSWTPSPPMRGLLWELFYWSSWPVGVLIGLVQDLPRFVFKTRGTKRLKKPSSGRRISWWRRRRHSTACALVLALFAVTGCQSRLVALRIPRPTRPKVVERLMTGINKDTITLDEIKAVTPAEIVDTLEYINALEEAG